VTKEREEMRRRKRQKTSDIKEKEETKEER